MSGLEQESGLTAEQTRLLNEMMTGLTAEQRRLLNEMMTGLTAEQGRLLHEMLITMPELMSQLVEEQTLTAEQMRLVTQLDEMRTARNFRGIVAQEGAALALARDVRVADPSMAGAILSALGNAHYSLGNFSQAIAYHTQRLAIAREVGNRAGEGRAYGNLGNAHG